MKKARVKKDPFTSGTAAAAGWNAAVGLRTEVCFLGGSWGSYLVEFTIGPARRVRVPRYDWPLATDRLIIAEQVSRPVVEATHGILTIPGLKWPKSP